MANALTVAQLNQAGLMISQGNLDGFYNYMESQGYNYAYLGQAIVDQTGEGAASLQYLLQSAQAQGVTLSSNQIATMESKMASAWVGALNFGDVIRIALNYSIA